VNFTANIWVVGLRIAPFLILPIAPFVFTRFLCRRVLAAPEGSDAAAGWFGFMRTTSLTRTVFWFAWVGGVVLLDPWKSLAQEFAGSRFFTAVLHNTLTVLPPALILAFCEVMTFPVVQRVQGLNLERRKLAVDAFLGRLWLALPAALMWMGFTSFPENGKPLPKAQLYFIGAGIISLITIQIFWLRRRIAQSFVPHAMTTGTLRDRAFEMAHKARVKLSQIYVIPMAEWRLANAYASDGQNLLLTDWLLRHLTPREVDAIIAHELAHMKGGHVSKLSWLSVLLLLPLLVWFRFRNTLPDLEWVVLGFLTAIHLQGIISKMLSRRYEKQADIESLKIGGDAEAMITALVRVDELNTMPHGMSDLDEAFSTHPATRRRIKTIGEAAGLNPEQIEKIRASPNASASRYTLPPVIEQATAGDGPVFSTVWKQRMSFRSSMMYVAVISLPPAGLAWVLIKIPSATLCAVVYVAGLALYFALIFWAAEQSRRRLPAPLRAKLLQRVSAKTGQISSQAYCVGLSPGKGDRLYEGGDDWDMGYLWLGEDQIVYRGEQTSFALLRDELREINVGPGLPGIRQPPRLFVKWENANKSAGAFTLSCPDAKSSKHEAKELALLARKIGEWQSKPAGVVIGQENLARERHAEFDEHCKTAELKSPNFGEVTSTSPCDSYRARNLLLITAALAFLIFVISGGPNWREHNLLQTAIAVGTGIVGHIFAMAPGWWRCVRNRNPC
jgi:Zn-dependent protease with chaperone function